MCTVDVVVVLILCCGGCVFLNSIGIVCCRSCDNEAKKQTAKNVTLMPATACRGLYLTICMLQMWVPYPSSSCMQQVLFDSPAEMVWMDDLFWTHTVQQLYSSHMLLCQRLFSWDVQIRCTALIGRAIASIFLISNVRWTRTVPTIGRLVAFPIDSNDLSGRVWAIYLLVHAESFRFWNIRLINHFVGGYHRRCSLSGACTLMEYFVLFWTGQSATLSTLSRPFTSLWFWTPAQLYLPPRL